MRPPEIIPQKCLPYDYVVLSGAIPAVASQPLRVPIILDQNYWFRFRTYRATCSRDAKTDQQPNNFNVQIQDLSSGRFLQSESVPQALLTPYNPEYSMRRHVYFPPLTQLNFYFTGTQNDTVTFDIAGYKYANLPDNGFTNDQVLPFDYLITSPTLSANGNGITTLTLQQDSYFELHQIAGTCSQDAVGDVMPNNFSVQIQDTAQDFFSSALIPERLITPYNNKYLIDEVVQFRPGANLQFQFLDLSGNTNTAKILLRGFKIFPGQ